MSIYGTCKKCGDETKDYSCANCLRKERDELEAALAAAERRVAELTGPTINTRDCEPMTAETAAALDVLLSTAHRKEQTRLAAEAIVRNYEETQRLLPLAGGIAQPIENSTDKSVMLAVGYLAGQRRVAELEAWKESALAVEQEWDAQAIAKELDLPLGCSIRGELMPAIRSLKDRVAELEAGLETAEFLVARLKSTAYEQSDRDACETWLKRANELLKGRGSHE